MDSILRVWRKVPNLTVSPKPWCLGKKRTGGNEEAIHDVEEAIHDVEPPAVSLQCWDTASQ